MSELSLNQLQADVERLRQDLADRDGELPLGLSVFYRGSLILGRFGLIGAATLGFFLAILLGVVSAAVIPLGAFKVVAGLLVFMGTWTGSSYFLMQTSMRLTRHGLRRVLDRGAKGLQLPALSAGGSVAGVPSTSDAGRLERP